MADNAVTRWIDKGFRIPFAHAEDGRLVWRSEARRSVDYSCGACKGRVRLRSASLIAREHLYHLSRSPCCPFGGEGAEHEAAKHALAAYLESQNEVELVLCKACGPTGVDLRGATVKIEKLCGTYRADVGVSLADGSVLAFEVFRSSAVSPNKAGALERFVEFRARDLLENLPRRLSRARSGTPGWLCRCPEREAIRRPRPPLGRPGRPLLHYFYVQSRLGRYTVPDFPDERTEAHYLSLGYEPVAPGSDTLVPPPGFIGSQT